MLTIGYRNELPSPLHRKVHHRIFGNAALHFQAGQFGTQACQFHLFGTHRSLAPALQVTPIGQPSQVAWCLPGDAYNRRRHRRLLPGLGQPNGVQFGAQRVPRVALILTFLAHLLCSMTALSALTMECMFRVQGHLLRSDAYLVTPTGKRKDRRLHLAIAALLAEHLRHLDYLTFHSLAEDL